MICRRACLLLAILTWAHSATGEVRTIIEPRLVDEMETVRLTLRAEGVTRSDSPDLTPLEIDFEVLGTQTSSRISTINGRTSSLLEYQINLRPRRTGEIIVPALRVGDQFSKEIVLMVRPLDPGLRRTIERMVFFESELTANPVYVQAETTLIRRLYYSNGVQIYSDLPGVPEIENAVVIPLGDTQSSSSLVDGQRYGVIEQRFAIFPERSGLLDIPAISVTSSVRLQSGGRTRRSGIRVSTESLQVEVLPIPDSYPGAQPWLPAQEVELSQAWAPQSATWDVGEPVTWEIELTVTGNTASAIPPVAAIPPASHFKVYPEAPVMDEDATGESVVGHRREGYALIPTAPGQISLPTVAVTWWDTLADELRVTRLEPRNVAIIGEPTLEIQAEVDSAGELTPQAHAANEILSLEQLMPLLIATFVVLSLAFAGYVASPHLKRALATNPFWQHLQARRQSARDEAGALRDLERACRGKDLLQVRQTLSAYLTVIYGCTGPQAQHYFRTDADAAAMLDDLNKALYAVDTGTPVEAATDGNTNGVDSIGILLLAKRARRPGAGQKSRTLPPLYGF